VAEAARARDETATAVWRDAGTELARTVVAALRAVGAASPAGTVGGASIRPVVSWSGGVFAAGDLILDPFRAELARLVPGVEVRPPLGDGIAGAARLLAGTEMFDSLIRSAG
jgi:predicted NBD/HSP70 family sugar kinase